MNLTVRNTIVKSLPLKVKYSQKLKWLVRHGWPGKATCKPGFLRGRKSNQKPLDQERALPSRQGISRRVLILDQGGSLHEVLEGQNPQAGFLPLALGKLLMVSTLLAATCPNQYKHWL